MGPGSGAQFLVQEILRLEQKKKPPFVAAFSFRNIKYSSYAKTALVAVSSRSLPRNQLADG